MELKIGDKVRFINEVGGGVITAHIGKDMVKVLNESDFEIPVLSSELVVIEQDNVDIQQKAKPVIHQSISSPETEDEGDDLIYFDKRDYDQIVPSDSDQKVFFALVPHNQENFSQGDFDAYLINTSYIDLYFNFVVYFAGKRRSRDFGVLERDTKVYLESYTLPILHELTSFEIQGFFVADDIYCSSMQSVEKAISVNPVSFHKRGLFCDNDFFDEKAMVFSVTDPELSLEDALNDWNPKLEEIVFKNNESILKSNFKSPRHEPRNEEVDLHIDKIVEFDYRKLSAGEMILTQMSHFRSKMNEAIGNHCDKIIFIHGIGAGTLRTELRKALENEYTAFPYQDASFKEYGYGATLVYLKNPSRKK